MGKLKKPDFNAAGAFVPRRIDNYRCDTLYEAVQRKYPKYVDNFAFRFKDATGRDFEWENITPENLDKFVQYLNACGLSPNSVNQYCKKLKAVIGLYSAEKRIDASYRTLLTTPTDDCFFVYINDDEVDMLLDYLEKLKTRPIRYTLTGREWAVDHKHRQIVILKQFLVGLFTGARHSDYIHFTWNNVREAVADDGTPIYVLTYTSQKTGIKADVPLPMSSPIISIIKDMPRDQYPTGIFNDELRLICHDAGLTRRVFYHIKGRDFEGPLYAAISSHSARRSFASNYLSAGANLIDVMHFMGHSNTEQTLGYNQSGPRFDSRIIDSRKRRKVT